MREDMARVLVERVRHGFPAKLQRRKRHQLARLRPESAPRREPMSRGRGTKALNENLAPLRRFLQRQVGRPWDAVYAEISARLRARSAVQQHVRDHLADFVATTTWLEGDHVVAQGRWGQPDAIDSEHWGARRFYVCPRSGLLREQIRKRCRRSVEPDPDVRWDGPMRQLRRIDGIWFAFALAPIPDPPRRSAVVRDFHLRRPLVEILRQSPELLVRSYGRTGVYAAAKRQLSKRELKRLDRLPMGRREVRP
jgi:hypothetical protein